MPAITRVVGSVFFFVVVVVAVVVVVVAVVVVVVVVVDLLDSWTVERWVSYCCTTGSVL